MLVLCIILSYVGEEVTISVFFSAKASSTARQKNLLILKDYMQRCTNELYWLDQQADERVGYDWSDANLDYPARKRQYEVRQGSL